MDLVLVTAPSATPIALADAKQHLAIEHANDDALITALIAAATSELDGRAGQLRRALVLQAWDYYLPAFPDDVRIELPFPPLSSVTFVKYFDLSNTQQTVDSATYDVNGRAFVGYAQAKSATPWPTNTFDRPDAVQIRFVCGYASAASVPAAIRHALLLRVAQLYANRGDESEPNAGEFWTDAAIMRLLAPHRVPT